MVSSNFPTVGVILSVYKFDRYDYFRLSVNSILDQTYTKIKLYIGVDGPVESTMHDYLLELNKINNVNVHFFPFNRGLASVLNDLLTICFDNGIEYVARMDADDISTNDRISKQIVFLIENSDIDILGGAIEEIDSAGQSNNKIIHYPTSHKKCFTFFKYRNPLAHPTVVFKSSFFKKIGHLYNDQYKKNQDTILWFDGFNAGCKFENLQDVILKFRVNNDFFTNRRNGLELAINALKTRLLINKTLKYQLDAYIFALAIFFITISPIFIKKFFYKIR